MPLVLFRNSIQNLLVERTDARYEFHIAKDVRIKYDIDDSFFSITGNVVLTDFPKVRKFVQKLNAKRKDSDKVSPGYVNAMGLLDEIYHFILREYETTVNPGVFSKALNSVNTAMGEEEVDKLLLEFITLFPPTEVYKEKINAWNYLNGFTENRANRLIVLEELLLLYFANYNPANKKLKELFDVNLFRHKELFYAAIINMDKFFENEQPFGPDNQDIFKLLKTPIDINPDSLEAQLEFVIKKWEIIVKDKFSRRILSSKDLMREDVTFGNFGGAGGGAPTVAPQYKGGMSDADFLRIGKSGYQYAKDVNDFYEEPENFTSYYL